MNAFLTWLISQIFLLGMAAAFGAIVGHYIGCRRALDRAEDVVDTALPKQEVPS